MHAELIRENAGTKTRLKCESGRLAESQAGINVCKAKGEDMPIYEETRFLEPN